MIGALAERRCVASFHCDGELIAWRNKGPAFVTKCTSNKFVCAPAGAAHLGASP